MLQTNSSRITGAAVIIMTAVLLLTSVFTPQAQAASKFKTLHGFKGGKDGSRSFGGLVFDAQGNLYGTT